MVKMADVQESMGYVRLQQPIMTNTIKFTIKGVHSANNNGFEKIFIWTTGMVYVIPGQQFSTETL